MLLTIAGFLGDNGLGWAYTYIPMTLVAVMVAILIHTIMLMAGRAFHIRELESFAMSEILQAAATAVIAIFLVTMLESALGVAGGLIYGEITCGGTTTTITGVETITAGQTTAMDAAYEVIKCRLQERAKAVAGVQKKIMEDSYWDFMTLNLQASVFGITAFKGEWISSVYERTERMRISNNLATVMLIGLNAQYALAEYLRINLLSIFIPVGVLLRSFYFTRGPGALFMALGIGMYFIFPVMYILLDPGFVKLPQPEAAPQMPQSHYCYATMSSAVSLISTMQTEGVGSTANLEFGDYRTNLKKSYTALMLHPLIALSLTLVFVRYIMSVLGGDTYELTRMVSKVI